MKPWMAAKTLKIRQQRAALPIQIDSRVIELQDDSTFTRAKAAKPAKKRHIGKVDFYRSQGLTRRRSVVAEAINWDFYDGVIYRQVGSRFVVA